jgi:alpha-L-fucosidase
MEFQPTSKSLKQHQVPQWYDDAKLGVFIHWGLYSVPAFGTTAGDINTLIQTKGVKWYYKNNPYAEWYWNSIRIPESPAAKYHHDKYGSSFKYEDFSTEFNDKLKKWDPNEWAELFKSIGAKYVCFTSKHHDGFRLYQSSQRHPTNGDYCANRDVVGELQKALQQKQIKLGTYYSGALDWSFTPNYIRDATDLVNNGPKSKEYATYVDNQYRELIDRYHPCILWNDIGSSPKLNLNSLFAYYYNNVQEGLINDRWIPFTSIMRVGSRLLRPYINFAVPKILKRGPMVQPKVMHFDYQTPEYSIFSKARKDKWELTRGVGNSFGYNQFEGAEFHLTGEQLIQLFIDIVSKNGNLLINVGPKAGGEIPEFQKTPLLALGNWLRSNGQGIFGTRPWKRAEGITTEEIPIRFTQNEDHLFAFIMKQPATSAITIKDLVIPTNAQITLLGANESVSWSQVGDDLIINLNGNYPWNSALTLDITPKSRT